MKGDKVGKLGCRKNFSNTIVNLQTSKLAITR